MRLVGIVLLFFLLTSCDCPHCGHMPNPYHYHCAANGESYVSFYEYEGCPSFQDSIREVYKDLWDSRKEVDCQFERFSYYGYYVSDSGHFNLRIYLFSNDSVNVDTTLIYLRRGSEEQWYHNVLNQEYTGKMITSGEIYLITYDFSDTILDTIYSDEDCRGTSTIPFIEDIIKNITILAKY